jgi:hypothetical protein
MGKTNLHVTGAKIGFRGQMKEGEEEEEVGGSESGVRL